MANVFDFTLGDTTSRRLLVDAQAPFFTRVLDLGAAELKRVEEKFDAARDAQDNDALDWFASEGAETLDFVEESAELAMVAMYHWVERTLKRELVHLLDRQGRPAGTVKNMNYDDLKNEYAARGVAVAGLADEALSGGTLRFFANSWKHNPGSVGTSLLRDLGLGAQDGHFGVDAVRDALGAKLGIGPGHSGAEIVGAFVPRATDFLKAVIAAVG